MSDIGISIAKRYDRSMIDAAIAANETIVLSVFNEYSAPVTEVEYDLSTKSTAVQNAFKIFVDSLTYSIERYGFYWEINRNGNEFDLSASYKRDFEDTTPPLPVMDSGQPLLVKFEVISFSGSTFYQLPLWYGNNFLSADVTVLEAVGIQVTGNGSLFTVTSIRDCKISFHRPTGVSELYVFNINGDTLITP